MAVVDSQSRRRINLAAKSQRSERQQSSGRSGRARLGLGVDLKDDGTATDAGAIDAARHKGETVPGKIVERAAQELTGLDVERKWRTKFVDPFDHQRTGAAELDERAQPVERPLGAELVARCRLWRGAEHDHAALGPLVGR